MLEEKKKQVEEFYKSDSDSDDPDDVEWTPEQKDMPSEADKELNSDKATGESVDDECLPDLTTSATELQESCSESLPATNHTVISSEDEGLGASEKNTPKEHSSPSNTSQSGDFADAHHNENNLSLIEHLNSEDKPLENIGMNTDDNTEGLSRDKNLENIGMNADDNTEGMSEDKNLKNIGMNTDDDTEDLSGDVNFENIDMNADDNSESLSEDKNLENIGMNTDGNTEDLSGTKDLETIGMNADDNAEDMDNREEPVSKEPLRIMREESFLSDISNSTSMSRLTTPKLRFLASKLSEDELTQIMSVTPKLNSGKKDDIIDLDERSTPSQDSGMSEFVNRFLRHADIKRKPAEKQEVNLK